MNHISFFFRNIISLNKEFQEFTLKESFELTFQGSYELISKKFFEFVFEESCEVIYKESYELICKEICEFLFKGLLFIFKKSF